MFRMPRTWKMPVFPSQHFLLHLLPFCIVLVCTANLCRAQQYTSLERDMARDMLSTISEDVKKHYYDPKFHGFDWDAKVSETIDKINQADSLNKAFSYIAAAMISLEDSHTYFTPPPRPYVHEYGFQMQMIGNRCLVTRVKPKSNAETQGIKPGDEIVAINGYTPNLNDFWKMKYTYYTLRPQQQLTLKLHASEDGERQVIVQAKFSNSSLAIKDMDFNEFMRDWDDYAHAKRIRWAEKNKNLLILKLPTFMIDTGTAEDVLGKMRKHEATILDLRGNGGGSEDALRTLLGGLFPNSIKIADKISRRDTKPLMTSAPHTPYSGKLVVLIDSRSASASELFARVVQLEKRGLVVGDQSSGKVMESRHYTHHSGGDILALYGDSITEADLLMTDGQSLELHGVTPDTLVLPTSSELAKGQDQALSTAAGLLDIKISPEEAGAYFPYEWRKE